MCNTTNINTIDTTYLNWNFFSESEESFDLVKKPALFNSIKTNGCLSPILCLKTNNTLTAIDGYQRLLIAKTCGQTQIPYTIVNSKDSVWNSKNASIPNLIYELHQKKLDNSPILKLRFIDSFKLDINQSILSKMKLPYYSHIKIDIQRILKLSDQTQHFLDEKGYSLKEILHLIHHSPPLLTQLISNNALFNFSKQSLDQIITTSADLMKRHQWDIQTLLNTIKYNDIYQLDQTPQQRLKKLESTLKKIQSPIFSELTKTMTKKINILTANTNIQLKFDASFESKAIELSKTLDSIKDIEDYSKQLSDPTIKQQINAILAQL